MTLCELFLTWLHDSSTFVIVGNRVTEIISSFLSRSRHNLIRSGPVRSSH